MAKDKDKAMEEKMAMAADEIEESISEGSLVEAEVDLGPTPTMLTISVQDFNEIKNQQAELMKMLKEERQERQALADTLAATQQYTSTPLTAPGEPQVLLEGREWGPYPSYELTTTPFGEYAVEVGQVLSFVAVQRFNKKEGRIEMAPVPVYRDATEEERAAQKLPDMAPLPSSKIAPPTSFEEAMKKMAAYLDNRTPQGFTHVPVPVDE